VTDQGDLPGPEASSPEVVSSHLSRIARGSLLVFFGNVAARALRFLYTLALTRTLGRERYGLFSLAFTVHRIPVQLARNGLPHAIVKFVSHHHALGDEAGQRASAHAGVAISAVAGGVLGATLFALAPWLAEHVYQQPGLVLPLRILAVSVMVWPTAECLLAVLQGVRDITPMVVIDALCIPALLAGGSWLVVRAWRTPAAAAAVYSGAMAMLLIAAAVAVALRVLRGTSGGRVRDIMRPLLLFALPLMVMELSQFGLSGLDVVLLGHLLSPAEVGTYAGAMPISNLVPFGLVAVRVVFSPTIAMLHARGRREAMRRIVVLSTAVGTMVGMAIFGLIVCFDEPLMHLLGRDFAAGAPVLLILSVGWLVNTAAGAVGLLLVMTDRPWIVAIDNVIFAVVMAAGLLVLVPAGGLLAAAAVAAATNAGVNIVRTGRARRILGFWPYDASTVSMHGWFAAALLVAVGLRMVVPGMTGRAVALVGFGLVLLGSGLPLTRRTLAFLRRREAGADAPAAAEDDTPADSDSD